VYRLMHDHDTGTLLRLNIHKEARAREEILYSKTRPLSLSVKELGHLDTVWSHCCSREVGCQNLVLLGQCYVLFDIIFNVLLAVVPGEELLEVELGVLVILFDVS
jgi:hypothetical protein